MTERCTTYLLDVRDVERSVQDPKLAGLLSDGWRVIASAPVDVGTEDRPRPSLLMVLAPPVPVVALSPVQSAGFPWFAVAAGNLCGIVAAALVHALLN